MKIKEKLKFNDHMKHFYILVAWKYTPEAGFQLDIIKIITM